MSHPLQIQRGHRLVDLVNEIERRLTGDAPGPGLAPELAAEIPDADTYVVMLADGLGHHQLDHPAAGMLRRSSRGVLAAPFPTTTTVSLATVVTGLSPVTHGIIGHLMWLPELDTIVNTLKWITQWGQPIDHRTEGILPSPNLWERLADSDIEGITVQPAAFEDTKLSRALYRGCRFEGVRTVDELIEATVTLARQARRLIFTYLPQVDVAAHVSGQRSSDYTQAMSTVDTAWAQITTRLAPGAVALATADHGHLDYDERDKVLIRDPDAHALRFYGDPRSVYVKGDADRIATIGRRYGAAVVDTATVEAMLGDGPRHPRLSDRLPDALLRAPRGRLLLPKGFDRRLVGYHGGTEPEEVEVPLLVGRRTSSGRPVR